MCNDLQKCGNLLIYTKLSHMKINANCRFFNAPVLLYEKIFICECKLKTEILIMFRGFF